jgi:putative ABC transport system permease protein
MKALIIALRLLGRRPVFSITATITLAFGIGATTALFSVVDAVLVKPLPFPGADRLVSVMEANPSRSQKISLIAPGRLEDWNRENRAFEALSGSYAENVTDTSGREPQRLEGRRVAPRFFDVFGMAPLVGRTFTPDEERFGGPPVALISESLWTRRYGRDPAVIERRLVFAAAGTGIGTGAGAGVGTGRSVGYSIVGVMPKAFTSAAIDIWLPEQTPPGLLRVREARFLSGVGRIKRKVTLSQATADLVRVERALGDQYPESDQGWSVSVGDLKELRIGEYRRALWLVFGAVALLFAIAIANIAGLTLVQLHRRARELSIRQAIGGSRSQIVGTIMLEVLAIAAAGSAAGAVAAFWLLGLFAKIFATVPRMNELTLDWRALAFTAVSTAAAALVFGLWPSLHATRGNMALALAQGGRGASAARHRLQQLLVVAQIALGILLVASAGLMLRSYYNLSHVDAGFRPDHAITFHVGAAWDEDRSRIGQLQERLINDLQQLPRVVAAGMANFLPSTGATLRFQVALEGIVTTEDNGKITAGERTVSGGYLRAMGVPLVAGQWCPPLLRDFKAPQKALVNRAFADRYGPDLIGRHLTFDQSTSSHEIVGIVGDVIEDGPGTAAAPYVYACASAGGWPDPEYVIRTEDDPRASMAAIRQLVHAIDPNRAVFGVKTVDEVIAAALDQPRLNAGMLSLFAGAAMTLASIGLYSLLMLLVSEQTRELGVRVALGAAPAQVVALVLACAGRLFAGGIAAGLLMTLAAARVLGALLFGVSPLNGPTLSAAVLAFALVTLLAVSIPAWRAARIDPIEAMRAE